MPADKFSESVDIEIEVLKQLGQHVQGYDEPKKAHAVKYRTVHQQDQGNQQHWQKLHDCIRSKISRATRLRDAPVDHRPCACHQQRNQQSPRSRQRYVFADYDCNEPHKSECHRQPVPDQGGIARRIVVVSGADTRQQYTGEEYAISQVQVRQYARLIFRSQKVKTQAADQQERNIRSYIPEIGNTQYRPRVCELVVGQILRNRLDEENRDRRNRTQSYQDYGSAAHEFGFPDPHSMFTTPKMTSGHYQLARILHEGSGCAV